MKKINRNKVTHLTVFKEKEGVWSHWGYYLKLKYVPYRKHKWWEFGKETKEGFYEDGQPYLSNCYRSVEYVQNSEEWISKDGSIYTIPHIQIFVGGEVIHTEYFTTFEKLENHVGEYYRDCDVEYF